MSVEKENVIAVLFKALLLQRACASPRYKPNDQECNMLTLFETVPHNERFVSSNQAYREVNYEKGANGGEEIGHKGLPS